jgi:hypothetical protein
VARAAAGYGSNSSKSRLPSGVDHVQQDGQQQEDSAIRLTSPDTTGVLAEATLRSALRSPHAAPPSHRPGAQQQDPVRSDDSAQRRGVRFQDTLETASSVTDSETSVKGGPQSGSSLVGSILGLPGALLWRLGAAAVGGGGGTPSAALPSNAVNQASPSSPPFPLLFPSDDS